VADDVLFFMRAVMVKLVRALKFSDRLLWDEEQCALSRTQGLNVTPRREPITNEQHAQRQVTENGTAAFPLVQQPAQGYTDGHPICNPITHVKARPKITPDGQPKNQPSDQPNADGVAC
jgi:hypothetical protein